MGEAKRRKKSENNMGDSALFNSRITYHPEPVGTSVLSFDLDNLFPHKHNAKFDLPRPADHEIIGGCAVFDLRHPFDGDVLKLKQVLPSRHLWFGGELNDPDLYFLMVDEKEKLARDVAEHSHLVALSAADFQLLIRIHRAKAPSAQEQMVFRILMLQIACGAHPVLTGQVA